MLSVREEEELLALLEEDEAERAAHPLRFLSLWDHPSAPSQRGVLRLACTEGLEGVLAVGGNGTGKSLVIAAWVMCGALGGDHPDVQSFARLNDLDPLALAPRGPGRMWVASPTFGIACESLRPHLQSLAPAGFRSLRWTDKQGEGELHLPGGGVIVSKAYRQYLSGQNGRQSWESAQIRGIAFDEHPETADLLAAGLSRTRTVKRLGAADVASRPFWMVALTHLAGRDWFWREYLDKPKPLVPRIALDRRDNPYLDQVRQDALLASYPEWQRAARERGDLAVPQGQRFPQFSRAHNVIPSAPIPSTWRLRRRAIDLGGRAPHVLWLVDRPDGTVIVYRELAPRRPAPQNAITEAELVRAVREAEGWEKRGGQWKAQQKDGQALPTDPVLGGVHDSESATFAVEARSQGLQTEPAAKGPGSRIVGYNLLERYLRRIEADGSEHPPALLIMDCCPVLIDELEQLRWEPERPGTPADERDTHPEDPDHGPDALRYELQRREAPHESASWTAMFDDDDPAR